MQSNEVECVLLVSDELQSCICKETDILMDHTCFVVLNNTHLMAIGP